MAWSSVHVHLANRRDSRLAAHPVFLALGSDPQSRADSYANWLTAAVSDDELTAIRRHSSQQRALGDPRFQTMVERTLNRLASCRRQGRPSHNAD